MKTGDVLVCVEECDGIKLGKHYTIFNFANQDNVIGNYVFRDDGGLHYIGEHSDNFKSLTELREERIKNILK
jgi:hypothetical protein